MEDEKAKEGNEAASTSKKETKDRKDEEDYDDRERDDRSYSETTGSEYSGRSRVDVRKDTRGEQPKVQLNKRDVKMVDRKRRPRRGRVVKRRRSAGRRYQPLRRAPKRKVRPEKRDREASISTIFTRMSSASGSDARSCTYCGHRCCGRRSKGIRCRKCEERLLRKMQVKTVTTQLKRLRQKENKYKRRRLGRTSKKSKRPKIKKRRPPTPTSSEESLDGDGDVQMGRIEGGKLPGSEAIQAGSASKLLSPLFVRTNATLEDEELDDLPNYTQVSPDMIYDAVKRLAGWRQMVPQETIMEYVKNNYPVNPNTSELAAELFVKLRIATLAGILMEATRDGVKYWCICCELQRRMTKNHVSLFWKIYADTLSPVHTKHLHQHEQSSQNRDQEPSVALEPLKKDLSLSCDPSDIISCCSKALAESEKQYDVLSLMPARRNSRSKSISQAFEESSPRTYQQRKAARAK